MLTSVVGLVMDECSVGLSTARQGVTRTVLLLLMDRFGDGEVTSSIRHGLEFPNRTAEAVGICMFLNLLQTLDLTLYY